MRTYQLLSIALFSVLSQYCKYFDYYYWYDTSTSLKIQEQSFVGITDDFQQGIGFWMNYRTLDQTYLPKNSQASFHSNSDQYFVFSLQSDESQKYTIYLYIEMLHNEKIINHNLLVQTQTGWQKSVQQIDYHFYDGDWIFFYCYMDILNSLVDVYYYSSALGQHFDSTISGKIIIDQNMRSETGGYKNINIENEPPLYLSSYPGLILGVFITLENLFDNFNEFLYYCPKYIWCASKKNKLIPYNTYMDGNNIIHQTSQQNLAKDNFLLKGWIKQDNLKLKEKLVSLLLRMTINSQYFDNNQIGDRALYILYYQSKISNSQNGFSLETYSYEFPYKPASYLSDSSNIKTVFGDQYQELLTQWHYFQFEIGTLTNNRQPIYRVKFPSIDLEEEYNWDKPIYHFANSYLYFHIGGDNYFPNSFQGYLSDWYFQYYCTEKSPSFELLCHYSCLTCKGISQNDCLSCLDGTYRIYSPEYNACICQQNYIDVEGNSYCQQLSQYNGVLELKEIEIVCNQVGYYQCDQNQYICDYGYFNWNDECIQWQILLNVSPHFDKTKSKLVFLCANCYFFPDEFSKNLVCTISFTSSDQQQVYIQQQTYDNFDEVYTIRQTVDQKFELDILHGSQYQIVILCKTGFFKNEDGLCKQCIEGCFSCIALNLCQQCSFGYTYREEGICVPCKMCHNCEYSKGQEFCYYADDCNSLQYWQNNKCFDCGQNCASCSQNQCFYCENVEQYFITLDNVNCAKCNIEHCKYCFQYISSSNNPLTTLDIRTSGIDLFSNKVKIGCALCQPHFFFSVITQLCEPSLASMPDCDFGLVPDQLGTQICILSEILSDSIQSSNCESSNCKLCINNYQQTQLTFCIKCQDGYYSSFLTGQCQQCPQNCETCVQQNQGYKDYWKWNIRAFYSIFVNANGNHPFESYTTNLQNPQFEVVCLSCPSGYILHSNSCIEFCSNDCLDCRFINEKSNGYQCFQCKSSASNLQRSTDPAKINTCLFCPDFCSACYPRTSAQITALNPFFDQKSKYLKYSHMCFELEQQQNADSVYSILPQYMVVDHCQEFKKCSKRLTMAYYVYCDQTQMYHDMFAEENQNLWSRYATFYQIMVIQYTRYVETFELFEYMNRLRIIEANYDLNIRYSTGSECFIDNGFVSNITSQLHQNVFTLKRVYLTFNSGSGAKIPTTLRGNFFITNFDFIQFQNQKFLVPQPMDWTDTPGLKISLFNDFNSLNIFFLDCELFQEKKQNHVYYTFISKITQQLTIINMYFADLNILDSKIFNFQPTFKSSQPKQNIDQFTINNSLFSNTSIFYYSAADYSLNYNIHFSNVTITTSTFSSSYFINSTYVNENDIGEMYIENCYLENVTFQNNSSFLYILSIQKLKITNLTLLNLQFLDSSSFLTSNVMEINQLNILDSIIYQGYFITNYGSYSRSKIVKENSKFISLKSVVIKNNIYSSVNSFLYLLQNEILNLTLHIDGLILSNNNYINSTIGTYSFDYVSYKQTLIYIDCSQCFFSNIEIFRGVGSPELSIVNSKYLIIDTFYIELNSKYFLRSLHSSVECAKNFIYLDIAFVLYIGAYQNVSINNITILNSLIIDYPFIVFVGKSQIEAIQSDSITIINSIFQNNLLLITTTNGFSSIISIQTEQRTTLLINNTRFINNHLNEYYQDFQLYSSTTILFEVSLGNIMIDSSEFIQNVLTNSTDATLYIKTQTLSITNCNFSNQNILNNGALAQNLILPDQISLDENIYQIFQILSDGGNGYLFVSQLTIVETQVDNSIAINGAGFYIVTKTDGIISIENSSFFKTTTILNGYQLSSGGLLYIDSSKSKLDLYIFNSTILQSYSRAFGGVLFIVPSRLENLIVLNYLTISSVFSLQHSILSYSPSKLISVASNVFINNSYFSNPQSEFEQFASQISELSLQNIQPFQTENPAIFTQFSNFTIINCSFSEMHLASLIRIDYGINIYLQGLKIYNSSIFQQAIFRLSLRGEMIGQITIENVQFITLIEFIFSKALKCDQILITNSELLCPIGETNINKSPSPQSISQNLTNQKNCNLNSLYASQSQNFSLIELLNFQEKHFLFISKLMMAEIICSICHYGLISIQGFNNQQLNFQFDNIKMINNNCGYIGCFSILKSIEEDYLSTNSQQNQNNQLNIQNLNSSISLELFQAKLTNSLFYNNSASYGGACFLANINLLIDDSLFVNNYAKIEGGAIYYYSSQSQLLIINSQIVDNSADIAGGIFLNSNQIQKTKELNLFLKNNQAVEFGDNLFEAPRKLYLSLNKKDRQQNINQIRNSSIFIDKVNINPYFIFGSNNKTDVLLLPSGIAISDYKYFDAESSSYVPYNLSLSLIATNVYDEKILKLDNTQCKLEAQIINMANNLSMQLQNYNNSNQHLSITSVNFDQQTGDYNLDDLIIYFNPLTEQDLCLQLAFSCNSISVPYYDAKLQSTQTSNIINYILLLNLRTFQCQLGEYLNVTSGGCVQCDIEQNQYSVTMNSTGCSFKDELTMKDIQPAMIKLREAYWRAFYYSETIDICYHLPANCLGGWLPGNPSCAKGHIGALCEQCDLYNVMGKGSFSQNQSYQCTNCQQMANNILNIIFVILWTLLSVLISVNSTIQMIDDFVFQLKLKPFGYFTIIKTASTSVLLKVFTNYFQIISSISTFQLQIPIGIILAFRGVGNPIESMAFSLDCYLILITSIRIIYFRIIWGFLMAGMYIFLFFSMHLLQYFIKKSQLKITFITTTLIYIYIYLSPNLVNGLSALISYRNISGERWIAANVAYLYNTQQHSKWLIFFVAPAFFIVSMLLPFFFWYILYHNRKQLNSTQVRKVWGYLYNEYNLSTYYWETIKILQKELIILVMIYYEDYVVIKASLIFFILLLYNKLAMQYKPYLTGDLNNIDYLSTAICQISIIFASSIYTAQQFGMQEIVWPFYIILGVMNFFFIAQMISKLLFAYFDKLYEQVDKVKALISFRFPFLTKRNKFFQGLLQNKTERKQQVRKRYQQIRRYLLQQARMIIQFKEQNNMDVARSDNPQKEGQSNPLTTLYRTNTRNTATMNTFRQQNYFQTQLISNRKGEEI